MAVKKIGGRTGAGATIGRSKPVGDRPVEKAKSERRMNENARKMTSEGRRQYEENSAKAFAAYKKKMNAMDTAKRNKQAARNGEKIAKNLQ